MTHPLSTLPANPRPTESRMHGLTSNVLMLARPPILEENGGTNYPRLFRVKRIFDLFVGTILCVATLPILLLAVAIVRLTSKGPGIYSQARLGKDGIPFVMYKVRTMQHNCEKNTGPRWSSPRDPRVTRVGKVLRKLHIDEFPQFWNVLRGEMSLIGPRPERPEIAVNLRKQILDYDSRLAVLPGMTGYAQIHLPPDMCLESVRMKLEYDRHYIRQLSLGLDLKIFACTMLKMLGLYRLEEISLPPINKDEPIDPMKDAQAA